MKKMLENTSMTDLMLTVEFSNLNTIGLCVDLQHQRIDFIETLNEK